MSKNIAVDPNRVFGLQKDLFGKIQTANKKQDHVFFDALEALLKASQLQKQDLIKQVLGIQHEENFFSLDKDVVPHKGSMYQFVSPYMRDKYFAKSTLSGPATIKIAPTTKVMTTKEIADEYQQTDVFAIVATLHNMLVVDPHSLDDYKDRAIIVPVMSILPNDDGDLFCLSLNWDGDGWRWNGDWVSDEWEAGVAVASVAQ